VTYPLGAPGWAAIDAAVGRLYPGVQPLSYGSPRWDVRGGEEPLHRVVVHRRADHWHLVTYGMSELYRKVTRQPGESGWGFEYTMRVAAAPQDPNPPLWAINLLRTLAGMVFARGSGFAEADYRDILGPISLGTPPTAQRAIIFVGDPELGPIGTPHGTVRFLQVFGLHPEEQALCDSWHPQRVVDLFRQHAPWFVTDLDRVSLLTDPAIRGMSLWGQMTEGSGTEAAPVLDLSHAIEQGRFTLNVGALDAPMVGRVLRGRLPLGLPLRLDARHDPSRGYRLVPGPVMTGRGQPTDTHLELVLPRPVVDELVEVLTAGRAGRYELRSEDTFALNILPTRYQDFGGNVQVAG
jgi:hypothetical protein